MANRTINVVAPRDEHTSVSVRKIENGYISRTSSSGPKGYAETERFHPEKPALVIGPATKGERTVDTPKGQPKATPKAKPAGVKRAVSKYHSDPSKW